MPIVRKIIRIIWKKSGRHAKADLVGGVGEPARAQGKGHGGSRRGAFPVNELARAGRRVGDHAERPLQRACIKRHHLRPKRRIRHASPTPTLSLLQNRPGNCATSHHAMTN